MIHRIAFAFAAFRIVCRVLFSRSAAGAVPVTESVKLRRYRCNRSPEYVATLATGPVPMVTISRNGETVETLPGFTAADCLQSAERWIASDLRKRQQRAERIRRNAARSVPVVESAPAVPAPVKRPARYAYANHTIQAITAPGKRSRFIVSQNGERVATRRTLRAAKRVAESRNAQSIPERLRRWKLAERDRVAFECLQTVSSVTAAGAAPEFETAVFSV